MRSLKGNGRTIERLISYATQIPGYASEDKEARGDHAEQIRGLAPDYGVGLVDSLAAFEAHTEPGELADLMSWSNHPNRAGHEIVCRENPRWFPLV